MLLASPSTWAALLAGRTSLHHYGSVAQQKQEAMLYESPTIIGGQQQLDGISWAHSAAPLLPSPTPGPTAAGQLSSTGRFEAPADPFVDFCGCLLGSPSMQQPCIDPSLPTPATAAFCHQGDDFQTAFDGDSPDSAQSLAWGFFSTQAVGAEREPQGHQQQGHYQARQGHYQERQGHYQERQGHYQEAHQERQSQWQHSQGHFQGHFQSPYQEQPQMKESLRQQLKEQLEGQLKGQLQGQLQGHRQTHIGELMIGSRQDGLYNNEGPKPFGGTHSMPAAAEVAAPLLNPLKLRPSKVSSASRASRQHGASADITPWTQPSMSGQRHDQRLETASSAALLPSVGSLMPLANVSGHKRQACENQEDELERALEDMLASLPAAPAVSSACWTDGSGNSGSAAYAHGQHMQPGDLAHMAQVQAIAQQLLSAAAVSESEQREKKQKTGRTSSCKAVNKGPVPVAAHGPTTGPTLITASPMRQGRLIAALSPRAKHHYPSVSPSPMKPPLPTSAHGAVSDQSSLQGTKVSLQTPPLPTPLPAATPLQPSPLEPQQPSGALYAGAPPHTKIQAARIAQNSQLETQPPFGRNSLQPAPQAIQARPHTQPQAQPHPQALSRPQRQRKARASRQSRPKAQARPRHRSQRKPQPKVGAPPSKPAATPAASPAATRTAAPAAAPATVTAAAPAATPAATPAAAPAQESGYQEGQLVWAKCRHCPWWPAIVSDLHAAIYAIIT